VKASDSFAPISFIGSQPPLLESRPAYTSLATIFSRENSIKRNYRPTPTTSKWNPSGMNRNEVELSEIQTQQTGINRYQPDQPNSSQPSIEGL
jgi:hypothetical protein